MTEIDAGTIAEAFGIKDARARNTRVETETELSRFRAVNGHDQDAWVPITGINVQRDSIPNFAIAAWLEVSDAPGEFMTVITAFRTNKGQLECLVPANTKYYIGVGTV